MTELFIPSHLLGARWAQREACQSRGGELLRRADLTRGVAVLSQHCPTLPNFTGQDRTEAPVRQLRHAVGLLE